MNSENRLSRMRLAARRCALSLLIVTYGWTVVWSTPATAAETRIYTSEQCLITGGDTTDKFVGALLALFLPTLIDKGLTAIGGAIRNAGKKQEKQYEASIPINLYEAKVKLNTGGSDPEDSEDQLSISPEFSCILIANGEFADDARGGGFIPLQDYNALTKSGTLSDATTDAVGPVDGVGERLRSLQINFEGSEYNSLYEAKVAFAPDRTAFYLQSQFLHVFRHNSATGRKSKRGLVYTISLMSPRTDKDGATISLIPVNFGEIEAGTMITKARFADGARGAKSPLATTPAIAGPSKAVFLERGTLIDAINTTKAAISEKKTLLEAEKKKRTPDRNKIAIWEQEIPQLDDEVDKLRQRLGDMRTQAKGVVSFMPVNLVATLTETRDENAALLFLADVFDESKKSVGDELKNSLIPENREKIREGLEDAHSKAYVSYLAAQDVYLKALDDPKTEELQLDIAREKRDQALRELNRIKRQMGVNPILP